MELNDVKKPDLKTAKEVAGFMKITIYTLYRLVRNGKIKAINVAISGTKPIYAFRAEDIQAYYDQLSNPPSGDQMLNQ